VKSAVLAIALSGVLLMQATAPLRAQFDHLVVAIRSLPEGVAEFERATGVTPTIGGKHPGRGTENALVSLGDGKYLEIIAPQEGAQLSPMDEGMRRIDTLHIIGWAVSVSDVGAAVAALKQANVPTTSPQPGSRVTPAGTRLEWTTLGLADRTIAMAPFFIHWSASTRHPSTTTPGGCSLDTLTITDPNSDRLAAALGALGVRDVSYAKGALRIDAALACGSRKIALTTPTMP
jgi:Glyoxalase-like domain